MNKNWTSKTNKKTDPTDYIGPLPLPLLQVCIIFCHKTETSVRVVLTLFSFFLNFKPLGKTEICASQATSKFIKPSQRETQNDIFPCMKEKLFLIERVSMWETSLSSYFKNFYRHTSFQQPPSWSVNLKGRPFTCKKITTSWRWW